MARVVGKLTQATVKNAARRGYYGDEVSRDIR